MNHIATPIVDLAETKFEWPLEPDALTIEELIAQQGRALATVVDIGTQLLQEKHNETVHPPGWRTRAFRAKRTYEQKVHLFQMLIQERQAAAKRETKLKVAEIHAQRDREQASLFVAHVTKGMTHEARVALWQAVRDANPDDPCWEVPI